MSLRIVITCDECYEDAESEQDSVDIFVRELRREGWLIEVTCDLCPECAKEPEP